MKKNNKNSNIGSLRTAKYKWKSRLAFEPLYWRADDHIWELSSPETYRRQRKREMNILKMCCEQCSNKML